MDEAAKNYLYLIKSRRLAAYKIGIANETGSRIAQHLSYDWTLVALWEFDNRSHAQLSEKAVLKDWIIRLKAASYLTNEDMPQKGSTETVNSDDLLDKIRKESKTENQLHCELTNNWAIIDRIESIIKETNTLMVEGVEWFRPARRIIDRVNIEFNGADGITVHELEFVKKTDSSCGCEGYQAISRKDTNPPISRWPNVTFRHDTEKRCQILELVLKTLTEMQREKVAPCRNNVSLEYYGYTSGQIAKRIKKDGYEGETLFSLTLLIKTLLEEELKFNTTSNLFRQKRFTKKASKMVVHWTYGDRLPIEKNETLF